MCLSLWSVLILILVYPIKSGGPCRKYTGLIPNPWEYSKRLVEWIQPYYKLAEPQKPCQCEPLQQRQLIQLI